MYSSSNTVKINIVTISNFYEKIFYECFLNPLMINQQEAAFGILVKWNTTAQNLCIEYKNHLDLVHSTMY